MRKFYIVFNDKDATAFQGTIDCSDKDFQEKLIKPLKQSIYSYYLAPENKINEDELTEELKWT